MHGRKPISFDSISRETVYSFMFFNGLLTGIVGEYNSSHLRLLGIYPNELEIQKYGKLTEESLLKEILANKYPGVNFDESIDWTQVCLIPEMIDLIEIGLKTRYPVVDFSHIDFTKLKHNGNKSNQSLIKTIEKANYPKPYYIVS
jgi:hypothetical protein